MDITLTVADRISVERLSDDAVRYWCKLAPI